VALPYSETWTGSNGASWSGDWTTGNSSGATVDHQDSQGRMLLGFLGGYSDYARAMLTDQGSADFDMTVELYPQNQVEMYPCAHFRGDGAWHASNPAWPQNGYGVEIKINNGITTGGWWTIDRVDSSSRTNVSGGTQAMTIAAGDTVYINVRCVDTSVELRVWQNAEGKPTSATFSFTDSTHNTRTGHGLAINGGGGTGNHIRWDNLAIDPITRWPSRLIRPRGGLINSTFY
jgi:hypothetical protein